MGWIFRKAVYLVFLLTVLSDLFFKIAGPTSCIIPVIKPDKNANAAIPTSKSSVLKINRINEKDRPIKNRPVESKEGSFSLEMWKNKAEIITV